MRRLVIAHRVPKSLDRALLARSIIIVLKAKHSISRTMQTKIKAKVLSDDLYVRKALSCADVVTCYHKIKTH